MLTSSLPSEIVGEIFALCLPERHSDRLSIQNAPMLVCQVSSGWRKAAIGEPRLWDTIIFPPSNFARNARFIHDGGIERWFDRTGRTWPLSFGDEPSQAPSGSNIIQYYARRFKHLSCTSKPLRRGFPQDVFDQLDMEMNSYTLQAFPRLVMPFKTAAKLERVSFILLQADMDKFVLPWSQLTSIEMASRRRQLNAGDWRNLFGLCRNLRRGTFVFPGWRKPSLKRALVHPTLESLTLIIAPPPQSGLEALYGSRAPGYDFAHLLSAVAFPNIQHLRFEFEADLTQRVHNIPSVCRTMRSSLKTVVFGWQGEADRDLEAPIEASEFLGSLIREPGAFDPLKHVVLPCKSNELDHIVTVLRSHPRLSLTVTAIPGRVKGWMQAMERHEDPKTIKDRIRIVSTGDYYLLDVGSY
ncbi:hypothetical protein FA13DRAFT_1737390 [Coprinellus micaceus]|uniref:F-box domain-containing protein n=1 Tax=Coprinellus micaceus TaxID=71717 RepID=A0A4Y7SXN3_COPMI|nr:hypothetical protein FA13DRAFT_1737390 [Coprinellus micaceus]